MSSHGSLKETDLETRIQMAVFYLKVTSGTPVREQGKKNMKQEGNEVCTRCMNYLLSK